MRNDIEQRLADRIHCELRQLPLMTAPPTLVPRVIAALQARAHQPWWRKSWADWPMWCRLLFLLVSLSVAGGYTYLALRFGGEVTLSAMGDTLAGWLAVLRPAKDVAVALMNAGVLLARSGGQLVFWLGALVVGGIYLTSVGLGTVCYRLALNKL